MPAEKMIESKKLVKWDNRWRLREMRITKAKTGINITECRVGDANVISRDRDVRQVNRGASNSESKVFCTKEVEIKHASSFLIFYV